MKGKCRFPSDNGKRGTMPHVLSPHPSSVTTELTDGDVTSPSRVVVENQTICWQFTSVS